MPTMRGSRENVETPCTIRHGYVSVYNQKTHRARVRFPDKDDLVSYWLPVLVPNTRKNRDEAPLDEGEHVVCLFLGNGLEMGYVLGSVYDNGNLPPVGNRNIRVANFEDGTRVFVDREKHQVEIKDSFGSRVRLEGGNIYLQAAPGGGVFIHPAPVFLSEPMNFPEPESPPAGDG
jgi:phage baseplate assembly protein V